MTKRLAWLMVILICVALGVAVPGAAAQTPGLQMTVTPAWEGAIRLPGWTEFLVQLTNEGPDWEGALTIADGVNQITYRYPVLLPAHSRKQYRLPYFADETTFEVVVHLEGPAGLVRAVPIRLYVLPENEAVCGVVKRHARLTLDPTQCAFEVALRDLAALPELAPAWDTVDLLVLNGISTADLTAGQREALLAWVAGGGRLAVAGGPALPQVLAGLPAPLQIGTGGAPVPLSLPGSVSASLAVPLQPQPGAVPVMEHEGVAFALRQPVGLGQVWVAGWELTGPATLLWPAEFWPAPAFPVVKLLPAYHQRFSARATPDPKTLAQVPARFFRGLGLWLGCFPVYILVMGPGTWWLVRRLRRPWLAWVCFPLWVGLTLLILAAGLQGSLAHYFPLVHQVAYVAVSDPALPARVFQSTALYAPQAHTLSWQAEGTARPLWGRLGMEETYDYSLQGVPFPAEVTWLAAGVRVSTRQTQGMLTWATEGVVWTPALQTALTLTQNQGQFWVSGQLQSEQPLSQLALVLEDGRYWVPLTATLVAGQPWTFSQPISLTRGYTGLYDYLYNQDNDVCVPYSRWDPSWRLVRQEVASPLPVCYLMARGAGVPFPLQNMPGSGQAETCFYYRIPCPTLAAGRWQLGPELLLRVVDGWEESDPLVYTQLPATEVHYWMPALLRLQTVTQLTVTLAAPEWAASLSSPVPYSGTLSLWSWEQEQWVESPAPLLGKPLVWLDAEAQQWVDREQGVRLQLAPRPGAEGPLQVLVTLEGYR